MVNYNNNSERIEIESNYLLCVWHRRRFSVWCKRIGKGQVRYE